ncbi:MAG: hypothetical protein Q7S11_00270 [bacterium]|nr:hypothetical protein [bacterium]
MNLINVALILVSVYIFTTAIASIFWFPLPFFTKMQGAEVIEGRVSSIKQLSLGVMEIGLTQGLIPPGVKVLGMSSIEGSVTFFVHCRGEVPFVVNQLVSVKTKNRFYLFHNRSLNWVQDWHQVKRIVPGGKIQILSL